MSQRVSGYERKERDLYETPEWVTEALVPHLPSKACTIWEPAAGSGKIVGALIKSGFEVISTDSYTGEDFLARDYSFKFRGIVTNPPYEIATPFIERALNLISRNDGFCAMLLRTDFDHAKTRQRLFGSRPRGEAPFAKKLVLTKRIRWFENTTGNPSYNHAWFIWNWQHQGFPELAYGP